MERNSRLTQDEIERIVMQPESTLYVHQHSQCAQSRAAHPRHALFRISGMAKPQIIKSPLSRVIEEGGVSVDVRICRLENTGWSLEIRPVPPLKTDLRGAASRLWEKTAAELRAVDMG
jgi:hypothetical protein